MAADRDPDHAGGYGCVRAQPGRGFFRGRLEELAFSARLNKRLAPIVCRRVDDRAVPEALAGINRIDFVDARFETMVKRLVQVLLTNIEWIRKHTEFGEAAQRWHLAGRPGPGGLMLRPPPLDEAELWIAAQPPGAPEPTEAIRAFVAASRAAFDQEEAAQLAQIAEAEQLRGNFDTALKLSVRAARRGLESQQRTLEPSRAAAILTTVVSQSGWRLLLAGHGNSVSSAAFSPDGLRIVTAS